MKHGRYPCCLCRVGYCAAWDPTARSCKTREQQECTERIVHRCAAPEGSLSPCGPMQYAHCISSPRRNESACVRASVECVRTLEHVTLEHVQHQVRPHARFGGSSCCAERAARRRDWGLTGLMRRSGPTEAPRYEAQCTRRANVVHDRRCVVRRQVEIALHCAEVEDLRARSAQAGVCGGFRSIGRPTHRTGCE